MVIRRDNNVNLERVVKKAVNNNPEFHFYVDELTANNYMPTYAGMADEKYTFNEMDEGFFSFLNRKISENGVYLRICYLTGEIVDHEAIFNIDLAGRELAYKTNDFDNLIVVDMSDYGIKITSDEIVLGTTIDGGCGHTPYFAEFGSSRGNESYLSCDNPLNKFLINLINEFLDET
ncbi:hypothetical protein [Methanobrevibacter sp.]|uniref:hypothetical protein n=1 Tax=Methanobrevibacter sp. TaxID=66852 RepID=UPI00388DAC96